MYYLDILRLIGELKRTSVKNCLSNPFYQKYNQPLPRLRLVFLGSTTIGEVNLGHCLPKNIHLRSCQPKYAVLVTCGFVVNYIYCLFCGQGCPALTLDESKFNCFVRIIFLSLFCLSKMFATAQGSAQTCRFEYLNNRWWFIVSSLVSATKLSSTKRHRIL